MTNRLLLWSGALALSAVAFAGSKTYDLTLSSPEKVGSAQLAAGEYKLKLDGSNAIITGAQNGKSVTVPVKVENGDTKYDSTMFNSTTLGGSGQITSIELGGSKTKLEFGK
jgi:hypothetical protein